MASEASVNNEDPQGLERPSQVTEGPLRNLQPVVQTIGSADSDSELLLGCFDMPESAFVEEVPDGFPAHVFVVGSPPDASSPLAAFASSEGAV